MSSSMNTNFGQFPNVYNVAPRSPAQASDPSRRKVYIVMRSRFNDFMIEIPGGVTMMEIVGGFSWNWLVPTDFWDLQADN